MKMGPEMELVALRVWGGEMHRKGACDSSVLRPWARGRPAGSREPPWLFSVGALGCEMSDLL